MVVKERPICCFWIGPTVDRLYKPLPGLRGRKAEPRMPLATNLAVLSPARLDMPRGLLNPTCIDRPG
jgi:hypothetical protein